MDERISEMDPKDTLKASSSQELVRAITETALGPVGPLGGYVLSRFLPDRFRSAVVEVVSDLCDRVLDLETAGRVNQERLAENEHFQAAVFRLIPAAMGTVSNEKRRALRNVAVNAALETFPNDDLFEMFMRYVEDFTPLHIRLLKFAENLSNLDMTVHDSGSSQVFDVTVRARQTAIEDEYPELKGLEAIYEQAWSELVERGLVKDDHDGSVFSHEVGLGVEVEFTTSLGHQFLDFISDPV
jgi:hypothetical protein